MRFLLCLAVTACASYRVLPPPPLAGGVQQIPVRYEKSSLLFFKSSGDDGAIARVFAADSAVLATVARPERGVYASADAGQTWTFAAGPFDFREVIFANGHLYARGADRVWHSEDRGRTWSAAKLLSADDRLDAMALGPDGALYTAGRSQLYVSHDGARSFRPLSPQLPDKPAWRVRSIVPDPRHAHIIYVSLRTEPQQQLLPRFQALLDFSSDEAVSALKLVDSAEAAPRWGPAEDGVYVTQDGGGLWKKTGFSLDAWLTQRDGVLYAVAAEPILQAAALVRRYPDLAGAAERQFKGGRADAAVLRESLQYPGREALLAGPAAATLAYRSSDDGATWQRLQDPPLPVALALRAAIENGGRDLGQVLVPSPEQQREQRGAPGERREGPLRSTVPLQQGRYRGVPRSPQQERPPPMPAPRALTPDTLLSFVDPMRLLARSGGVASLTEVSADAAVVPTRQGWDELVAALVTASTSEGEISLGPARPQGGGFELLRSADGGASWAVSAAAAPSGAPLSLASAAGAVYFVRGDGRTFRIAP